MWDAIIRWAIYSLPWYVQGALLAIMWSGISVAVGMLFGWKYARMMMWPVVALIGAIVLLSRARQQGYTDRRAEEEKAFDHAVDDFEDHRQEVDKKPIDQIDKENSKWLKP